MAKGFGDMMKQAQRLQKQMLETQEQVAQRTVEGSSGGGMVKVVVNGRQEIQSVKIDPEAVDPQDVELLEDLVMAAVNNALDNSRQMMEEEMGKIIPPSLGKLNIPGLT
jgi:DNA-binding YbaB/EbfC family protein